MAKTKNIVIDNKKKRRLLPLVMMFIFSLALILISQATEKLNHYNLSYIPNVAGFKTIEHDPNIEDISVAIDSGWYLFPNVTCEEFESQNYSFLKVVELPHYENVKVSQEYGWNDLGTSYTIVNSEGSIPYKRIDGTNRISAMYLSRISIVPNTDTVYLHLDEVNGNGKEVGNVGNNSIFKFDISHSSQTYPVNTDRSGFMDIIVIVESDSRIGNPGITLCPTLTSNNDENVYLVANSVWFFYQLISFFIFIVGGIILARTFVNKRKLFATLVLSLLYIIFAALDSNFIELELMQAAILKQSIIIALIVISYLFMSYLFYDKELSQKHFFLKVDYLIILVLGLVILCLEYWNKRMFSSIFPTVSALSLLAISIVLCLIKVIFLYSDNKNANLAMLFISAFMHTIIYMINGKTTVWEIKIYTIFFVILFFVVFINYTQLYVKQFNEVSNMSTRLQYLLKEKTQHISEINKDLYKTNKMLMENEEARKNVLSNVSHDLRTPITAIRGYAELLMSAGQNMKPEQVQSYLGNIIKRSAQMERIVYDIVELTRMESNTNEFQFTDVSIAEMLDELYMMYEGDTRGTGKVLKIDLPETDLLMVKADPKKISRVFENLISNSINYTYDDALIKIRAWREGADKHVSEQRINIQISDNGIGIPQEEIDKIFDRFYRAKNSGKNIKGTGLGLSIVKTIIDHHDATITVESTLGSGTTFNIVMKATY